MGLPDEWECQAKMTELFRPPIDLANELCLWDPELNSVPHAQEAGLLRENRCEKQLIRQIHESTWHGL